MPRIGRAEVNCTYIAGSCIAVKLLKMIGSYLKNCSLSFMWRLKVAFRCGNGMGWDRLSLNTFRHLAFSRGNVKPNILMID